MAAFDEALALSLCCGLGSLKEGIGYEKDPDCLECLKDLQRFLRHDDPVHRYVFFFLGKMNIAKTDLVPLIITYPNEPDIVYHSLKVLTFLSMPVEPGTDDCQKQLELIQNVKTAVVRGRALHHLIGFLANHLHDEGMDKNDRNRVQLVVVFIRNMLCSLGSDEDGLGTHEEMLVHIVEESVLEVLIALGERIHHRSFCRDAPVLLQAFHDIFKYVDPERILDCAIQVPEPSPDRVGYQPSDKIQRRALNIARLSRSLRYGSRFMNKCGKGIGNVVVRGLAPNPSGNLGLTGTSTSSSRAKRVEIKNSKLLISLRSFADKFLSTSYNTLMSVVAKSLEPGISLSSLEREDFLRFFQVMCFFTRYTSLKQEGGGNQDRVTNSNSENGPSPFHCIANTTSATTLKILQGFWTMFLDAPATTRDWEMQAVCIEVLKELLFVLDWAARLGKNEDRRDADKLQRRLLQDEKLYMGILQILSKLVSGFDWSKQNYQQASDLCECIHLALKTYQRLLSSEDGYTIKQKKRKRRQQATAKLGGTSNSQGLEGLIPGDKDSILEPAKENDLGRKSGEETVTPEDEGRDKDPMEELMDEMKDESEDEVIRVTEIDFDLQYQIRKLLAKPPIIEFYLHLLKGYAQNGEYLNHCIISFLRRISHHKEQNLGALLYQVSYMKILHGILSDSKIQGVKAFQPVQHFCMTVTKDLLAKLVKSSTEDAPDLKGGSVAGDLDATNGSIEENQSTTEGKNKACSEMSDLCARILFVEMLFGKRVWEAEIIQNQYNWKHEVDVPDDDAEQEKPLSSSEDDCIGLAEMENIEISDECGHKLEGLFELHNGESGCYAAVALEMGEDWTEALVKAACKKRNLKRGRLTANQEMKLKSMHSTLGHEEDFEAQIAEQLSGGFDASGIHAALLRLKLIKPKMARDKLEKRRTIRKNSIALSAEAHQRFISAYERNNGNKQCYQAIADAMGTSWTKADVSKVCKQLGLKKFKLTMQQEQKLRELYDEVKHEVKPTEKIASLLPGGFSSAAIQRKLKGLNLIIPKRKVNSAKITISSESNTSTSESEMSRDNIEATSSHHEASEDVVNPASLDKLAPSTRIVFENPENVLIASTTDTLNSEPNSIYSKGKKRLKLSKHEAEQPETHQAESTGLESGDDEEQKSPGAGHEEYIHAMKNATLLSDSDVEMQANNSEVPRRTLQLASSDDDT